MQSRIIRTTEGFRELENAWNELVGDSPFRAPFHSWVWYDTWWRHFGAGSELFLIAVDDDAGRLLALAPLMKGRRSLRGLPVREIGLLANSISPANAVLVRNGVDGAAALAAVLKCLAEHRREWDMLKLWNLPPTAPALADAETIGQRHGLGLFREPGWRSAYIDWAADFETYLIERFGKKRLRGIRQKVRQLSQRPGYQLLDFRQPAEIQRGLELAFAVSKASWKGDLGTDMSGAADRRGFYSEITQRLAQRGEVRIIASMLEQTPLAVQYQVLAPGESYLIINDFHRDYQAQSPGTVLLYQVIERLYQEPPRQFRFSGDLYDYKSLWATGVHPQVTLEFFHSRPYSRFLYWAKRKAWPMVRRMQRLLKRDANGGQGADSPNSSAATQSETSSSHDDR